MVNPVAFRTHRIIVIILTGLAISFIFPIAALGAEISIGTIIDTKGMVDDSTTISMTDEDRDNNNSAMVYRDTQMTNGGSLQLTKEVRSSGKSGMIQGSESSGSIESQKVLSYNAEGTGGHISTGESVMTHTSMDTESRGVSGSACTLSSGDSSGDAGSQQVRTSAASLDLVSGSALQIATRTRISPTDLSYSVTANRSTASGQNTGSTMISSSFTSNLQNSEEVNRVSGRSMVSGLFDLFTRVYHAGNEASIQEQTIASGMVGSKTVAEHSYEKVNNSVIRQGMTGTQVYADDVLTNGGNFSETRSLTAGDSTESKRVITYEANGSNAMQTEERVVAVQELPSQSSSSSGAVCVFAQGDSIGLNDTASQTVAASSLLFGVESAQITSTARLDIGKENNGIKPVNIDYKADITSPLLFDTFIIESMKDPDNDGLFEDLNGNGHRDMQDLVLLFKNFEGLSKSSYSIRFDYNQNGRVDLADFTLAFKNIRK